MDQAAFERVAASFGAFHAEFAPLFGRKEAQRRSEQYVRGLLVQQTERRNAENMAEAIEGAPPRTLQRFLTEAPWPTAPVIARVQHYVGARLSSAEGIFVLDESGVAKQGRHSVGVARQYCGTLGKVGNWLLGAAAATRDGFGTPLPPPDRPAYDRCIAVLRRTLSEEAFAAEWPAAPPYWRQRSPRPWSL
jgi:SRSO17 transposase